MSRWKTLLVTAILFLSGTMTGLLAPAAQALDNGVARTPPMGWNS